MGSNPRRFTVLSRRVALGAVAVLGLVLLAIPVEEAMPSVDFWIRVDGDFVWLPEYVLLLSQAVAMAAILVALVGLLRREAWSSLWSAVEGTAALGAAVFAWLLFAPVG